VLGVAYGFFLIFERPFVRARRRPAAVAIGEPVAAPSAGG
jgi:hypothetical protein